MRRVLPEVVFLLLAPCLLQAQDGKKLNLSTGKDIFQNACLGCHGADGRGAPDTTVGFKKPETFPDFSGCPSTTPEPDSAWRTIIHEGGKGRGFSPIMPSFADAFTPEQIGMVIQYLRGFCKEPGWAPGELNLPRALFTEKAFPESEAILTTAVNTKGAATVSNFLTYEQRLGKKLQMEVTVPFSFAKDGRSWQGGPGDISLGLKRVLYSSLKSGSILSVQGEVILPSGNKARGFGAGTTYFEGIVMYGQLLPGNSFLQTQMGTEQPAHADIAPRAAYFRSAVGKSFTQAKGLGRMWTPMLETITDRDFGPGTRNNFDIVPQFQVTLNRRQHIRANVGWRVPVNNTAGRDSRLVFYLLWDWFDGGFREGWR